MSTRPVGRSVALWEARATDSVPVAVTRPVPVVMAVDVRDGAVRVDRGRAGMVVDGAGWRALAPAWGVRVAVAVGAGRRAVGLRGVHPRRRTRVSINGQSRRVIQTRMASSLSSRVDTP